MNSFVKNIFMYIARKLKLRLEEVPEITDDYSDVSDINITAAISNRLSTITLLDSSISVTGDNARANYIDTFSQRFYRTRLKTGCEVALGTGDCIFKPNTDGKRIAIDIITKGNFTITESIGEFIYGILIKCDEWKTKNALYERIEYHKLRDVEYNGSIISTCFIYQMCFKDGKEVSISEVPQWQNIKTEINIPNVDRLLIGRIKCPTVNRADVNSVNGVPITYGLDVAVKAAKEAYHRFNQEYADKETMIFADKSIFTKDDNGDTELPKGKKRIIKSIKGTNEDGGGGLIHEYSPDIRSDSLETGIEVNFRMLEMLAGLSTGILTRPVTNYATATEMKANLQMTFAFITSFRGNIEVCIEDLLYAVDKICNRNNITPMGNYDVKFEWSDTYIENMESRFNQLVTAESLNWTDKAEGRQWTMNEDYEKAKARVEEISEESSSIIDDDADDNIDNDMGGDVIDDEAEETVKDVARKQLNGAQTQSLLAVMEQYSNKQLTIGQAINILVVSIGVTREEAKKIIEGLE